MAKLGSRGATSAKAVRLDRKFAKFIAKLEPTSGYAYICLQMDLGEVVYIALQQSGCSQKVLAKRLGVKRKYVKKLLQGDLALSLKQLSRIAFVLGYKAKVSFEKKVK